MNDPSAPLPDPAAQRFAGLRVTAWILYDLANTVYAATLTFLFTPYANQLFGEKTSVGLMQLLSMVCAALLVPVLGALTDHTTRTQRYLTIATLLCIAATAGFGFDWGNTWLLGCFFTANLTYNLGLLFYNALLPSVAGADRAGRIGGIGVGVGYFGTILVLATLLELKVTTPAKFQLAAGMFLLFALPCMLLVRDLRPRQPGNAGTAMRAATKSLWATLRGLPRQPALAWFLLANFCLVDVLNTAILYFADFTMDTFQATAAAGQLELLGHRFEPDNDGLTAFLKWMGLALNGLALVYGLTIGRWTDRAPLAVLRASAVALLLALIGGAAFGGISPLGYLLTLVALGAFGLTGIWTAGRKIIVLLAPPERIGEFFGLYGITVKLSVFGGAIYGLIATHYGSKAAMLAQGVQLLVGLGCLTMVRLPRSGDAGGQP